MSATENTKCETTNIYGFYSWTDTLKGVYYGPGSVKTALPILLGTTGAKRALVITGRTLHTKVRIFSNILQVFDHWPHDDRPML